MSNMNFLYENITNKIISLLESGVAPWKKTWKMSEFPMNLTTKIPYHGINVWLLLSSPNALTPYWLTLNQINKLGGTIKTGETKNYETVVFWKPMTYTNKTETIESGEISEQKFFPLIRYTRVYNLSQVEFSDETLKKIVPLTNEVAEFNPIQKCEEIVNEYKDCPEIRYGGDKASYIPLFDKINMPPKENFDSPEAYYKVLYHEMAHSTGAEKRLKRFKATDKDIFGSETYSKEELVAEMTAAFLMAESGIENTLIENSAAYIKGWLSAIRNADRTFVISAASKASYASNYILGRNQTTKTNN